MLARGGAERFDGRVLALLQVETSAWSDSAAAAADCTASCSCASVAQPERAGVGLGERLQLAVEALAPLLEHLPAALEVHEVRLLELQAGSRPACLAARLAELLLPGAEGLLGLRERLFSASSFSRVSLTFCLAPPAHREAHMWSAWVSCERCSRHCASWARRSVLGFEALARFLYVAQLGFVLGDQRVGRVEGLRQVQRVAGAVVRIARGLDAGLDAAQLGVLRLERVGDFRPPGRGARLRRGVAPAQVPEEVLLELEIGMQLVVARRHLGLGLELLELAGEARRGCP